MGCVESSLESDLQPNIFNVVNVHERGQRQRSCRLEVTDTHLILHQRGRALIRWPLRCLRRYGFDAEQFSFESGRRCRTGPGIYYFKCRRAEALFNILQIQIQNIAEDSASRDVYMPPNADSRDTPRTDSRTSSAMEPSGFTDLVPRSMTRPINNIDGGIASPPFSAPPGVNGGVGGIISFPTITGIGSIQSPGSSPVLICPDSDATSVFVNPDAQMQNPRLDDRDIPRPPSTPGTEPLTREPPSTPTDGSRSLYTGYENRPVHFINLSDRLSSYSSSGSDRPASQINHIDRSQHFSNPIERPAFYFKVDSIKSSYGLNPTSYVKSDDLIRCRHPLYSNVDTDLRRERDHVYENTGLDKDMPMVPPRAASLVFGAGGSGSSHSGTTTTTTTDTDQHPSQINYIQVDLDRGSDSSQTAPLSPAGSIASVVSEFPRSIATIGYAEIDFGKTEALRNTAEAAAMWETRGDGTRRTRHNSTFAPVPPLGRHNSTLSD